MNEVIKENEYYRHWDKANNRWVRHYFVTNAKSVKMSDGTTLQATIDAMNVRISALEIRS